MKSCKVTVNSETFFSKCGDLLLDSAIMNGIELPHDCRTGACGTCRVRLVEGKVFGGDQTDSDMIHACQARILSDLKIVTEPVPHPVSVPAKTVQMMRLARDVIGVSIELEKPFNFLAGQYCKLQFRGFPPRCYSPSYPLEGRSRANLLHFQVRKLADGAVSSMLGENIQVGHRVRLTGPFGGAFFRPDHLGRVVLSPVALGSHRCGPSPLTRSLSGPSANLCLLLELESCSRFTCTRRYVVWLFFQMRLSFPSYQRRRTFHLPFDPGERSITCRTCREMTWFTLLERPP